MSLISSLAPLHRKYVTGHLGGSKLALTSFSLFLQLVGSSTIEYLDGAYGNIWYHPLTDCEYCGYFDLLYISDNVDMVDRR